MPTHPHTVPYAPWRCPIPYSTRPPMDHPMLTRIPAALTAALAQRSLNEHRHNQVTQLLSDSARLSLSLQLCYYILR